MTTNRTGVAGLVREYFRGAKSATAAQVARDLGKPRTAVYAAMRDLLKAGYLQKDELMMGLYHVRAIPAEPAGRADLQVKIWRAIRINRKFTNWDLALYSGATLDYVQKYLAHLQQLRLVSKVGRRGQRVIYQVRLDAPQETPRMKRPRVIRQAPCGALLDIAWEIVRALKAGDRRAAAEAHARLGDALGGHHDDAG